MKKQRLAVLGSTGSIGASTLDVAARHPDRIEVVALTAATQVDKLLAQCERFRPRVAAMASAPHAAQLAEKIRQKGLEVRVDTAPAAIENIASSAEVDTVMAAIVGAAGLAPCLAAARAGKRLLLANKEALVVGGSLFMRAVREGGATLLPIDSEHSAIFQSLPEDPATWGQRAERIILMGRHKDRTDLGREFGATDVVAERGEAGITQVMDITGGYGSHVVLEAVGHMPAYDQAVGVVRPGGIISRVGVPQYEEAPIGFGSLFGKNARLAGGPAPVRNYLEAGIADVLSGKINPGKVFDLTLPLEQVADAYQAMDSRTALKVMLTP